MGNKVRLRPIKFAISLSTEQISAKQEILTHPVNFIHGKAGSGKTLLAVQIALDLLFSKEVERIVITRPTVSNEDNGFLPGTINEKMESWLVPIRDNMRIVYPNIEKLEELEREGLIEIVTLQHFRGRTFRNAVCIIDEYQNLNKQQLAMAIGRLGKNSKMIFCGDVQQIDLRNPAHSAVHVVPKLENSKYVYSVTLFDNHRHPAVSELLDILMDI